MSVFPYSGPSTPEVIAEQIAAAVGAHPDVAGLDGGVFGSVATHLPGRRLVGVRLGTDGRPVEIAVVLRLGRPIPAVVAELRSLVSGLSGGAPVDITVSDVAVSAR